MADFPLLVKLLANAAKLCWKYFIVSRNITCLPMFSKLISVGFLSPIRISLVLQTPALRPFRRKKKVKPKKVIGNNSYFWIIFSNLLITIAMSVANNFTSNVRMVDVGSIIHNTFYVFYEIFRHWNTFNLICLTSVEYIKAIILSKK